MTSSKKDLWAPLRAPTTPLKAPWSTAAISSSLVLVSWYSSVPSAVARVIRVGMIKDMAAGTLSEGTVPT